MFARLDPRNNRPARAGPAPTTTPPAVTNALRRPGRPLERLIRAPFEQRLGIDFSQVRIHAPALQRQPAAPPVPERPPRESSVVPSDSPRYIDKLFRAVSYNMFFGQFTFTWQEGSAKKRLTIPLEDVDENTSTTFIAVIDEVHDTREQAVAAAGRYARDYPTSFAARYYAFYKGPEGVILPTVFSTTSTPEFAKLWPGLRETMVEEAQETAAALAPIANFVNPFPFTEVDERGEIHGTLDPFDLLALLRLRRAKIAERWKRTRRRHSGSGVAYRVIGPHDKLRGTSVYVLKDAQGNVLYVGKGEALARLRAHISDPKKTQWFGEIAQVEVRATGLNNTQALALEEDLIGELDPLHNIDRPPFHSAFGTTMDLGQNLPKAQEVLRFFVSFGD